MGHWEGSYHGGRECCQEEFPRGAVTGHRERVSLASNLLSTLDRARISGL